jgi:hypothetical protein
MISKSNNTLRNVFGLSDAEEKSIKDFLQGSVYCWCKNKKGTWFSLLDLMGGDNRDWSGTPLETLYKKHIQDGKSEKDAFVSAGQESGWLLKKVIHSDKRKFETEETEINRKYRWLEN